MFVQFFWIAICFAIVVFVLRRAAQVVMRLQARVHELEIDNQALNRVQTRQQAVINQLQDEIANRRGLYISDNEAVNTDFLVSRVSNLMLKNGCYGTGQNPYILTQFLLGDTFDAYWDTLPSGTNVIWYNNKNVVPAPIANMVESERYAYQS